MLGTLRWKGIQSAEELAKRCGFNSAEELRDQLKVWKLPDWLVGAENYSDKEKALSQKSASPRLRSVGPRKDLPSAGNAKALFKERLDTLLQSVELLEHVDESLHGRHFVRTKVERADVFYPRKRYSEEEWNKICEQHDLDPDDKGFWDTNVVIRMPGGVTLSPSEIEATLIGVYALADGRMDLLLDALHRDPSSIDAETREEIRTYVEGARGDKDKRDGLKVLARQLTTWVRGGEVRPGRPPGLSEMDHAVSSITTKYRKDGLTDEEIARKLVHLKKEDGTSYSTKDVTELGDLGLSWS